MDLRKRGPVASCCVPPHWPEEPLCPLSSRGSRCEVELQTSKLMFRNRCTSLSTRKGNRRVSRDQKEERKSVRLQVVMNHSF